MRVTVVKGVSFDAAHFLPGYKGKCANMHGHHWVVELGVVGEVKASGMVVDFTYLKEFLKTVEDAFDHKCVNDTIETPTAENICLWVRDKLLQWKEDGHINFLSLYELEIAWIKIWETEDSYAEVRG